MGPAGSCPRALRAPSHSLHTRKGLVLARATSRAADAEMEVHECQRQAPPSLVLIAGLHQ